ncbi:hypothetical protein ABPG77_010411 [Micractinium sp. CCAP 211/92]
MQALLQRVRQSPPAVAGLLLQLGSTLCVSLMSIVAKLAGQLGLPVMELVLARSLVLLAVSAGALARQGPAARWPWHSARRWLLLLRGCLGLGAITSLYAAVQYLPLADVATITFLAPMFVAAAAPLLLGERAGRGVALAMPLCVVGVVLVSRPTFLFGAGAAALSMLGVAIAVTQAAFSAAAKLTIRALGSTEPVASIILSMAVVSTACSAALCVLLPGQLAAPRGAAAWALLGSTGLIGLGVQVLNTQALKLSKAAPTIAMSYFAVVWGLLADLALFHHRPSPLSLLGAALVCASSLLIVLDEKRNSDGGSNGDGGREGPRVNAKQSWPEDAVAASAVGQPGSGRSWEHASLISHQQLELAENGAPPPARASGGTVQPVGRFAGQWEVEQAPLLVLGHAPARPVGARH